MSTPDEKTRALLNARQFLLDLMDPKKTPRVPKAIRKEAYYRVKHYPGEYDISLIPKKLPKVFGPVDKE